MIKDKEKQAQHAKKHYEANKAKIKARAREWTNQQRIKNKTTVREYLQTYPCVDCGELDIRTLDFDHLRDKVLTISQAIDRSWSTNRLLEEIAKCEIRCANCHRKKTFEDLGWIK